MHGTKDKIARFHSNQDFSFRSREKPYDSNGYFIPASSQSMIASNLFPGNTHNSQHMVYNTTQQYQQHSLYNIWSRESQYPYAYNHNTLSYNGSNNQSAQEMSLENIPNESADCSLPNERTNSQDYTRNHFIHKNQNNLFSNPPKIRVRDIHSLNNCWNDYFPSTGHHQRVKIRGSHETNHSIGNKGFTQQQRQIPCFERPAPKNFEEYGIFVETEDSFLQCYKKKLPDNYQRSQFSLNERKLANENFQRVNNKKRSKDPQYFPNCSDTKTKNGNYYTASKVNDKTKDSFSCPTNSGFQCNRSMLNSVTSSDKNKTISVSNCEKNVSKPIPPTCEVDVSVDWRTKQCDQSFSLIRVQEENFGTSYSNNSTFTSGTSHNGKDDLQNSQRNNLNKINSSCFNTPISATKNIGKVADKSEIPRVQSINICENLNEERSQSTFSFLDNPYPNTTFEFDNSGLCNETHTNSESNFKEQPKHCISKGTSEQVDTTKKLAQKTYSISSPHLSTTIVCSNKETGNCENEKNSKLNNTIEKSKSSGLKQSSQTRNKVNTKLINHNESENILKDGDVEKMNKTKSEALNKELVGNQLGCSTTSTSQFLHSLEKPDIKQENTPETSASSQESKPYYETNENTMIKNPSSEEFKANIDRKKLDKLKQFLENSSSFDNFWCENSKKEKSPETCLSENRKHEDGFNSSRRRKLSKSCIVKNKNNQREMISVKNFKVPVKENRCNGFAESETTNIRDSVKDNTEEAQILSNVVKEASNGSSQSVDMSPKDVALTDRLKPMNKELNEGKISVNKVPDQVSCNPDENNCPLKRKDSVKENFERKKRKKFKFNLEYENLKSSHPGVEEYKKIIDVMNTFQKNKENYCHYCGSLRSADFFWLNLVTAELKCLYCF